MTTDIIGGFPLVDSNCKGCGKPLVVENAWLTDGCACNSPLGVNSMNETRWRLLMELQRQQARELGAARKLVARAIEVFRLADAERLAETQKSHAEAAKWESEGDMYGWNFHEGVASGTTSASIVFYRVLRLLEASGLGA